MSTLWCEIIKDKEVKKGWIELLLVELKGIKLVIIILA
jgi:hypothetical protein